LSKEIVSVPEKLETKLSKNIRDVFDIHVLSKHSTLTLKIKTAKQNNTNVFMLLAVKIYGIQPEIAVNMETKNFNDGLTSLKFVSIC
jgi:hypothetical protein